MVIDGMFVSHFVYPGFKGEIKKRAAENGALILK